MTNAMVSGFSYGGSNRDRTCDLYRVKVALIPTELCPHISGAEDRNRTGTNLTIRGILSPVRLPVPPPRREKCGGGTQTRTGE